MHQPTVLISALSLLSGLAIASPLSRRQAPNYPPHSQSDSFTLVANVTSNDLTPSVNGLVVSSYHTGAGMAAAVLVAPSTTDEGRIFYENGTAEEIRYNQGSIATDGGTPPLPYGLALTTATDPFSAPLTVNAGPGTQGIQFTQFPVPVTTLSGPSGEGQFFACEDESLPYGPAVGLYYAQPGLAIPAGCAFVTLMPQCSAGDGVDHPFANVVNCYSDVAGIDWSVYSAA